MGRSGGGLFGGDLLERLMEKGIDDAEDDDLDELEDPLNSVDIERFVAGAQEARTPRDDSRRSPRTSTDEGSRRS